MLNRNSILFIVIGFFICSCTSSNQGSINNPETKNSYYLLIELKEELNQKYLLKNYVDYTLSDVKISNRTKNELSVRFTGSKIKFEELALKMKSDENVISFQNMDNSKMEKSNSTNKGKAKTSPIKKNK